MVEDDLSFRLEALHDAEVVGFYKDAGAVTIKVQTRRAGGFQEVRFAPESSPLVLAAGVCLPVVVSHVVCYQVGQADFARRFQEGLSEHAASEFVEAVRNYDLHWLLLFLANLGDHFCIAGRGELGPEVLEPIDWWPPRVGE